MFQLSKSKHPNFVKLQQEIDSLAARIPQIKKRRRLRRAFKILKYFGLSMLFLFLATLILFSAQILNLKKIYDRAVLGKANLEQAVVFAEKDNFKAAAGLASAAENYFNSSLSDLAIFKNGYLISRLPAALSQLDDAESLLITAQFLSKAVYGGANFGQSLKAVLVNDKKLNFSEFSITEKRNVLKKIFEAAPELNGIKADLDLAYLNIERVGDNRIFLPLRGKISQLKEQINQARLIFAKAVPLSQLIPALAGYPGRAQYLVVLQNNDELRPTGGFLGTYGIMEVESGEILNFKTHDIYHLDMPLEGKLNIAPPEPIKKYLNDNWYMRDANWSPDWPTSARKIDWFYQAESALNSQAEKIPRFSGVIAITPKLITDLLAITGPVTVEGQIYNQTNFQDLLQYRVEKGFEVLGVSRWQRKEVIGDIAKELKIKIFDSPPQQWAKIANLAIDNLAAKDLQLYLKDAQLENLVLASGWGGEIKNYPGDYLLVVDANLAALKTDAVMKRSLEYKVSQGAGGLFSKLTLNYAHGGGVDWKTSAYKSYTRIYVPLGSQLIKINGYSPSQIDTGSESGKTWFGFYLTVQPGKINNLTVEYKLPESIISAGNYGLYIQRQPGKAVKEALVDLSFINDIKSYNPASLYMTKIGPNKISWEGDLSIDRSFNVNF